MLGGRSQAHPASRFVRVASSGTLPLSVATRIALATTLFFVVCGSSGVAELVRIGSPLRWAALAVFTVLAVLWAAAERVGFGEALRVGGVALLLSALGFISVSWSIAPFFTFERAVTIAFVSIGVAAAAAAARARHESVEALAETVVATTLAICLGGVLLYAVNPAIAAEPGHEGTGFRFSGLGESPNTIPMLAALAACFAGWLAVVRGRRGRIFHTLAFVAFCAEVAASGSRGAAVAVVVGMLAFSLAVPVGGRGRRAVAILVALAAGVCLIAANRLVQNLTAGPVPLPAPASASAPATQPRLFPRPVLPAFSGELGHDSLGPRSFFFNDGRTEALREAFVEGSERPILGFGFGTEVKAFVERAAQFESNRPENSYLGLYLELGAVGVVTLLLAGAAAVRAAVRSRARSYRQRAAVSGLVAAVAAGFALAIGQSYVYSAGNVATLTFWLALALAVSLAPARRRGVPRGVLVASVLVLAFAVPVGIWESAHARAQQNAGIRLVWDRLGSRLDAPTLDGFRRDSPFSCLLYAAGGSPGGYELCFDDGRVIQAIDRRNGRFTAWTLQPWGPAAATLRVSPAAVEATLHRLGAYGPGIVPGLGYQARSVR